MSIQRPYRELTEGEWKLRVLPSLWSEELWGQILRVIGDQTPRRHPQTLRLEPRQGDSAEPLYLKLFHPPSGIDAAKDLLRGSKAFRFLRQGVALAAAGFSVPMTVAAGEERRGRSLMRAFVVTRAVPGEAAPLFLRERHGEGSPGLPLAEKRRALATLGRQIRRLHDAGFVHGDLVPSNIFVAQTADGGWEFYLMDNDRTRRYPPWWARRLGKRNLVQLNRFPLPGISLQDRMRVFRGYSGRPEGSRGERKLLCWLEDKTRRRRQECDAVDPTGSFRKLMSWKPELAGSLH